MMGKENVLYDNSYGKNSSFSRVWSQDDPLLTLLEPRQRAIGLNSEPARGVDSFADPSAAISVDAGVRKRLGIIIPYRNRDLTLRILARTLFPIFAETSSAKREYLPLPLPFPAT